MESKKESAMRGCHHVYLRYTHLITGGNLPVRRKIIQQGACMYILGKAYLNMALHAYFDLQRFCWTNSKIASATEFSICKQKILGCSLYQHEWCILFENTLSLNISFKSSLPYDGYVANSMLTLFPKKKTVCSHWVPMYIVGRTIS
jgi:hypothetical protein